MKLKKILLLAALTLCTAACAPQKPTSVLVLYENHGWHKLFTDVAIPWLEENASAYNYTITPITRVTPVDKEYLKRFDVILQLDYAPYNWPEAAFEAFEDYIDNGRGGWVGFHHATLLGEFDGFPMWDWFSEFMGGIRYDNYIADLSDACVEVERPEHPVFRNVPGSFVIPDDEWYTYDKSPRLNPDIQVLAHVDEASYTRPAGIEMGDHPVIWTNTAKKAPNIYIQFGHSPKLMDSEAFRQLLLNAILYAAGRER
ncbi:MAG: ThuA domain-containing protein [Bacteroidales bacterium]|nr:ThuA domain-containing protein [Bacteroidales bacterium]